MTDEKPFRLWATGCAHVHTDRNEGGRESLAGAIRQSESGGEEGGPPFDWDVALHLGDICGGQYPPTDKEGPEVIRQFTSGTKHGREHFYNLSGNHDASGPGEECQWWYRKWIDPTGESSAVSGVDASKRPYPIEGTWERYAFRVGNLLFLMMSDRNDGGPPVGRAEKGGYPAGAVSRETFEWWKQMVEANRDSLIVSCHHHMLKETTVGSGEWEGMVKDEDGNWKSGYHGYFPKGAPIGAGYLYFVDDKPDAQAFESYLAEHPGAIAVWLGGHTHTHPDDMKNGRTHFTSRWGVNFVNVCALTQYHGGDAPMSRLLTFTPGSDEVVVQCYLHTSSHAPQGWYDKVEMRLELGKAFRWD